MKLETEKNNLKQWLISGLVITGTAIVMLSSSLPQFRKISEYSVHIMLGLLAISMFSLIIKKSKVTFAGLFSVAALCLFLKDASHNTLKLPAVNKEPNITVAHINLSNLSSDMEDIIQLLQEDSIDVVSFQELTPDWNFELGQELIEAYPFSKSEVRIDPYGMAIYSKHPFSSAHVFDCNGKPNIQITIQKDAQDFQVYSSYLTPALDKKSIETATKELKIISDRISNSDKPVIALGEYNMVYWTNEIKEFRNEAKLTNSRRDLTQGNLRVPYDHIFFSLGLECTTFKELRTVDASYVGIMGSYQIKAKEEFPTLNRQLSLK